MALQVSRGLFNARQSLMAVLPALAAESYGRAYPALLKLHMLQELADVADMVLQVNNAACLRPSQFALAMPACIL